MHRWWVQHLRAEPPLLVQHRFLPRQRCPRAGVRGLICSPKHFLRTRQGLDILRLFLVHLQRCSPPLHCWGSEGELAQASFPYVASHAGMRVQGVKKTVPASSKPAGRVGACTPCWLAEIATVTPGTGQVGPRAGVVCPHRRTRPRVASKVTFTQYLLILKGCKLTSRKSFKQRAEQAGTFASSNRSLPAACTSQCTCT